MGEGDGRGFVKILISLNIFISIKVGGFLKFYFLYIGVKNVCF